MNRAKVDSSPLLLIVGGSFDPPQLAHMRIGARAAELLGAAALLYVPTSSNPLKALQPESAAHRLAMLRLALRDVPHAEISTIELDRPGPAFTVDTLASLRIDRGPRERFLLLMGSDSAVGFGNWRDPEGILAEADIAVVLRPPHDRDSFARELERARSPRGPAWWLERVLDLTPQDASATEVRRRLAAQESVDALLDPRVDEYIRVHGLYRALA